MPCMCKTRRLQYKLLSPRKNVNKKTEGLPAWYHYHRLLYTQTLEMVPWSPCEPTDENISTSNLKQKIIWIKQFRTLDNKESREAHNFALPCHARLVYRK